jgi:hypothetical protein
MRPAVLSLMILLLSCSETSEPDAATLDPAGPYGDCSVSCVGWTWELDGAPACVCTPSCEVVEDCPAAEGIELECAPEDDPDPGRCVIPCDADAACPVGLACHPVAGCVWPSD